MGNKQSFNIPTLPRPQPPTCPPGCRTGSVEDVKKLVERTAVAQGNTECQSNATALNMARNDVRQKTEKWEQCYPDLALQERLRVARAEAEKYSAERRKERDEANTNYRTKATAAGKIASSARTLYQTLFEKEKELASFVGKRTNLEQLERRERRAFLDNDPQAGTGGAPGVRTMDDRVLLAFWITYGAALLSATVLGLQLDGARMGITSGKTRATAAVVVAIVGYAIPYYFINVFG